MFKNISRDKNLYKTVFTLSWPVIVQNVVNNSMGFLDSFMVGTMGERYLSGVTLANTVFHIVMLLLFGLQSGCSVLIAQYHGKGDSETINKVLGIGFAVSLTVTSLIALVVTFFPMQLYGITSNDPGLIKIAADYGRVAAFSTVLNAASMLYLSAQRSMENPRIGMAVLITSMMLNTFLNWVFIFGNLGMPAMGVEGAAFATLLSRVAEVAITFTYAARNKKFKLNFKAIFHPGKEIIKDFTHFSLPVVLNETGWGIGFSIYAVIFGHMNSAQAALAAYTIALNVERVLSSVYFGVGQAAGVIVGKELGAGRRKEAYASGVTLVMLSIGFGILFGALMCVLNYTVIIPYIFQIFGASAQTVEIGRWIMLIMAISVPFRSFNFCMLVGVLRGGGDSRIGMAIDLVCMYVIAIPLAAVSGLVFNMSPMFVYLMMNMEEFTKVFPATKRFMKKKWLRNVTR